MDEEQRARRWFLAVWAIVTVVKIAIAARLPLFVVSNEVGLGIVPDHPLGRAFRDAAGRLNQQVAAAMREVYFVAAGMVLPLQPFPLRD